MSPSGLAAALQGLARLSEDLRFRAEAPRRGWTGLASVFGDVTLNTDTSPLGACEAMATYNESKVSEH